MKRFGFYRALVVNNKDPAIQGQVLVHIPLTMPELDKSQAIWARPANNPYGGRNMEDNHHYGGTWMVPNFGSWVLIFFEGGDTDKPFYFGSLDIGHPTNKPSAPAECRTGIYENKWLLFKSPEGRAIVISDDPNDARVEITGKKRLMTSTKEVPHGDEASVYKIDENQTVILLDEGPDGREKLLIRTRFGDFIHVDIKGRTLQCSFENDIILESVNGSLHIIAKDIKVKATNNMFLEATAGTMHRKAGLNIHDETGAEHHIKATGDVKHESTGGVMNRKAALNIHDETGAEHHIKAAGAVKRAGTSISDHSSGADPAVESGPAEPANPTLPDGERDS